MSLNELRAVAFGAVGSAWVAGAVAAQVVYGWVIGPTHRAIQNLVDPEDLKRYIEEQLMGHEYGNQGPRTPTSA